MGTYFVIQYGVLPRISTYMAHAVDVWAIKIISIEHPCSHNNTSVIYQGFICITAIYFCYRQDCFTHKVNNKVENALFSQKIYQYFWQYFHKKISVFFCVISIFVSTGGDFHLGCLAIAKDEFELGGHTVFYSSQGS